MPYTPTTWSNYPDTSTPITAAALNNMDEGIRGYFICTSTTRPSSPFNGQVIHETNTGQTLIWASTRWIPFAPQFSTLVGSASRTAGPIALSGTLSGTGSLMSSNVVFTADGLTTYKVVVTSPRLGSSSTSNGEVNIHVTNGSNVSLGIVASIFSSTSTQTYAPLYGVVYLTPPAGTTTYNVSGTSTGSSGSFGSGPGGASTFVPATLEVYR